MTENGQGRGRKPGGFRRPAKPPRGDAPEPVRGERRTPRTPLADKFKKAVRGDQKKDKPDKSSS